MLIRKAQLADVHAIARVHVDSWRTTYQGIIDSDFLASLSFEKWERMWSDALSSATNPVSLYVAESPEHAVVGFAAGGPERGGGPSYRGEIYAIYLLRNQQRQGVGSELFRACVRDFEVRGFIPFLVWVLKANPACKFYEALGGRFLGEKEIPMGKQQLIEIAYGWSDREMMLQTGAFATK